MAEKIKLTVSGILADLNNGLDRKAIRTKYGLSATDVSRLFQHEKLKGARVRTAPAFELEDDLSGTKETGEKVIKEKSSTPKAKKAGEMQQEVPVVSTANAVVEEAPEEQKETPAPTGEIKEVAGTDEDVVDTKKGLW